MAALLTCRYCSTKSPEVRTIVMGDRAEMICPRCLNDIARRWQSPAAGRTAPARERPCVRNVEEMQRVIARDRTIPRVNLQEFEIDFEAAGVVPEPICREYTLIPLARVEDTLYIAVADGEDISGVREQLKYVTGFDIEVAIGEEESILLLINEVFA